MVVPAHPLGERALATAPGASLNSGLAALEVLAALGPAAFIPAQLGRVEIPANGERRIVSSGIQTEIIHKDTEFRAVARCVLADLAR